MSGSEHLPTSCAARTGTATRVACGRWGSRAFRGRSSAWCKRAARLVLGLLVVATALLQSGCALTAPFEGLDKGEAAPDLEVTAWLNVPGGVLRLSDMRGRRILVQFWSMDDPASLQHLDTLRAVESEYRRDISLVTVHVDLANRESLQDPGRVRAFLVREAITFPVGIDKRGRSFTTYQFEHVPHAVLLDEHGNVTWSGNLVTYALEPAVKQAIQEARRR